MATERRASIEQERSPGSVIYILVDEFRACRREKLLLCQDL
jgi:hypothetical protein